MKLSGFLRNTVLLKRYFNSRRSLHIYIYLYNDMVFQTITECLQVFSVEM